MGRILRQNQPSRLRWWRRRGEDFEFDAHVDPREGRIDRHDGDLVVAGAGLDPGTYDAQIAIAPVETALARVHVRVHFRIRPPPPPPPQARGLILSLGPAHANTT